MKYESGSTTYTVENNNIVSRKDEFYIVLFENGKGGIRLKEYRIFPSQKAAEENISQREEKRSY